MPLWTINLSDVPSHTRPYARNVKTERWESWDGTGDAVCSTTRQSTAGLMHPILPSLQLRCFCRRAARASDRFASASASIRISPVSNLSFAGLPTPALQAIAGEAGTSTMSQRAASRHVERRTDDVERVMQHLLERFNVNINWQCLAHAVTGCAGGTPSRNTNPHCNYRTETPHSP